MSGPVKGSRNKQAHTCHTCGVLSKHVYCKAHDPERAMRERAHALRVAAYRAKAKPKVRP